MVIELGNLGKTYGGVTVLGGVSLEVRDGDYFGLLGENGSGKSTIIQTMLGLIRPDEGSTIRLFGEELTRANSRRLRARIGVVGEAPQLRDDRTVWAYLEFFARLYTVPDPRNAVRERLAQVGLLEAREKRIRVLSRGMKQRLSLARALLHTPELLVLDEPINGLDPGGIRDVREILERERSHGRTIFLCSHLLSEVEKSCSRVAVIHAGRILACGETAEVAEGDLERSFLRLTGAARLSDESRKAGGE